MTDREMALALSGCKLFRDFTREELGEVIKLTHPRLETAEQGELLADVGDAVKRVALVLDGKLSERRTETAHFLRAYGRGELIGLSPYFSRLGTSHVRLSADTDCRLLSFDLMPLLEHESYGERIKDALIREMADSSVHSAFKMDILLATTVREKIMSFFELLRSRQGGDELKTSMNQTQMAEYFGVNRSALSRELNNMQREGIIEILPNRRYRIMKWNNDGPGRPNNTSENKNTI